MGKDARMLDSVPSAVVTVDKNEKKIYQDGQVFLNDGDNFELRFFNPLSEKIGIDIIFNGQKKNEGLLVLRPGEDITLDRFIGEKKKMLFETYEIDANNDAAVKAAASNGLIEIKFYKEKTISYNAFTTFNTSNYNTRMYSAPINTNNIDYSEYIADYKDNNVNYSDYVGECSNFNTTTTSTSFNLKDFTKISGSLNKSVNKKETGRIEKGPESKQELKTIDITFESNEFHKITYQLKPISSKPVEIQEIKQYCVNCGYRIRKASWNFCPKCSQKIND